MRGQPVIQLVTHLQAASAFVVALTLAGVLVLFPRASSAQAAPLTIVVPWASGGGTDKAARVIADLLARELAQPVRVENRTGNNGVTGHQSIADATPDGLTIGIATFEITTLHTLGLTPLRYTDYTVLSPGFVNVPGVHVKADSPYKTLNDLLEAVKKQPGKLKSSGSGLGSSWHLSMVGLLRDRGLPVDAVEWVPSQGSAPALKSLQAGEIDFTTNGIGESRALFESGKVRTLAHLFFTPLIGPFITVPTLQQAVGSSFNMYSWGMVVAPKNLQPAVQMQLTTALRRVYLSSEYKARISELGLLLLPYEPPAKLGESLYAEDYRNTRILTALGLAKSPPNFSKPVLNAFKP